MPIQILAENVASQIAAGEVIERPASVVKELVENALDAGSRRIDVRVEQAGRRLIEVADDGQGIPRAEIELAVARHATSKLCSAQDLQSIATLGFRGEALASIGSVARLSLTSRTAGEPVGGRILVEAGHIVRAEQAGTPVGTVVRVEDLFYNVPARLKFLKQDATERNQISALVTRYALAYPDVRMLLEMDGRALLQTSGSGAHEEILAQLYGTSTARQMLAVQLDDGDGFRLDGYISPIALTRSNRREITFFVNGRWVQDGSLSSALLKAYQTLLMVGRYPLAALFVQLPPEEVDVNVHPAKAEVRFRDPDRVFRLVQRGVRRALLAYSPVPGITTPAWNVEPDFEQSELPQAWQSEEEAGNQTLPETDPPEPGGSLDTGQKPASMISSGLLRLVGQVGAAFLVAEGPDGLYLIDQHAAHERVLYEQLLDQMAEGIPSQSLLEPLTMTFPPAQAALLNEAVETLNRLGFDLQPFGGNMFRLLAVPALFTGKDPTAAVRAVVEDFEEDETPLQAAREARLAARVCKRMAVKAGQRLSSAEQQALLEGLQVCLAPRTCPHGRPTMIHLSVDLLERQFGRRGSR